MTHDSLIRRIFTSISGIPDLGNLVVLEELLVVAKLPFPDQGMPRVHESDKFDQSRDVIVAAVLGSIAAPTPASRS